MVKTIGIVSLSKGTVGESFVKHEVERGLERLRKYGVSVKFMNNALKGIDFLKNHPEKRADDLIQAFKDPEIDMILCAIGGDDTYRLLPYLFDNNELKKSLCNKIFLGFSDSTINHFMLQKVGLNTFYGQAFLSDICEIAPDMLPYTKAYFEELLCTGKIREVKSSPWWYKNRVHYEKEYMDTDLPPLPNSGYQLLQGEPVFSGKIYGGCLDTIFDRFDGHRYADSPGLCKKYDLFPSLETWKGNILLLETSEEKMSPEKYEKSLDYLKEAGIFNVVRGVIVGKPADEAFCDEYQRILLKKTKDVGISVVWNVNVGHALPRCILPLGVKATVDVSKQTISFAY